MPLADLERLTGLRVDEGVSVNTLSGLIAYRLGRMPVAGDAVNGSGFRLEVESMGRRRVERARVLIRFDETGAASGPLAAGLEPPPTKH